MSCVGRVGARESSRAKIYAEVAGVGMSADAYHLTASHPEGLGAKLVMENALEDAGMKPNDIALYQCSWNFNSCWRYQ